MPLWKWEARPISGRGLTLLVMLVTECSRTVRMDDDQRLMLVSYLKQ